MELEAVTFLDAFERVAILALSTSAPLQRQKGAGKRVRHRLKALPASFSGLSERN
jgi:hypothetical protein